MTDANSTDTKYEKYRTSGITLMATIISLCAGATFGLPHEFKEKFIWYFVSPIYLALVQQVMNYLGSKWLARNAFDWNQVKFAEANQEAFEKGPEQLKGILPEIEKDLMAGLKSARSSKGRSDKYFRAADILCVCTVVLFIGTSSFAIYQVYPQTQKSEGTTNNSAVQIAPSNIQSGPQR